MQPWGIDSRVEGYVLRPLTELALWVGRLGLSAQGRHS
jgi:hypothetical protein